MDIRVSYLVKKDVEKAAFGFNIFRNDGTFCLSNNNVYNEILDDRGWNREGSIRHLRPHFAGERCSISFTFPLLPLLHGIYRLTFGIYDVSKPSPPPIDEIEGIKTFQVEKDGIGRLGIFFCQGHWNLSGPACNDNKGLS